MTMAKTEANKTIDDFMKTLEQLDEKLYESGSLNALGAADPEKAQDCLTAIEDAVFVLSGILNKKIETAA